MKIVVRYFDNYLLLTIIVLIVLPLLLGISNFYSDIYYEKIFSFFLVYFDNGYVGVQILYLFQYAVFVIMLVVYPLYPSFFSVEKYFSKRDPQSAIIEYEMLKKIVYALFPFFIFALAFIIAERITEENPLRSLIMFLNEPILTSLFFTIMGVIFFIVGSALLKIILLIARKEFRFYFAKISFRILSKKQEDDIERMRYLIKALNSYNKYIRRNLGLQINDLKKIYSKIISDPTLDKNHSIKELSIAFEDNDKLKTIRCLSGILKVADTEQFLIKEPIGKKLERWGAILGTMASTFAAVIGALATLQIPGFS